MGHASPVVPTPLGQRHTLVAHSRSCAPVGACVWYSSEAQVAACVAHVASVLGVTAFVWYSPLPHVLASEHGWPSSVFEKVVPVHAAQVRSEVALPSLSMPNPAAHVRQVAHVPESLKVPSQHAVAHVLLESVARPTQSAPPYAGTGLLQVRRMVRVPVSPHPVTDRKSVV